MPKPNTSSKVKTADSQTAGAKASTVAGYSGDSPAKSDMPPDKTYDMCKALCKEMSESILRCINDRFDTFETKFQLLSASQAELQARVAGREQAANDLDTRMQVLEAKCTELARCNTQLHT